MSRRGWVNAPASIGKLLADLIAGFVTGGAATVLLVGWFAAVLIRTVGQTIKTWSIMETIISGAGLVFVLLLGLVV